MPYMHAELAAGRWHTFPLVEQLAHVGSEIERTLSWREKNDAHTSEQAFERALELLDLTIGDPRWRGGGHLKELCRLREVLVDFFAGENTYQSTADSFRRYFAAFTWATRRGR